MFTGDLGSQKSLADRFGVRGTGTVNGVGQGNDPHEVTGRVGVHVHAEALPEEVNGIAKKIAANGPFALKAIKSAINRGIEVDLDTALRVELEEYSKVAHSQDAMAGMEAFFAKKSPVFKGK